MLFHRRTLMQRMAIGLLGMVLIALPGTAMTMTEPKKPAAKPASATRPAGKVDWRQTLSMTADGGMLMGNPKARVHIIEYASLTCPHCAHFHGDSVAKLEAGYIARGLVKYEFRNFLLNSADFAASLLARCNGPKRFFALTDAFFSSQPEWIAPFQAVGENEAKALQALPPQQQIKRFAELGKLDAFVRKRGIPKAMFDRCLTDKALIDQLTALRATGVKQFDIQGTPTVIVNGTKMPQVPSWDDLDARIKSELK